MWVWLCVFVGVGVREKEKKNVVMLLKNVCRKVSAKKKAFMTYDALGSLIF